MKKITFKKILFIKDIGEKKSVNINLKIVLDFYNLFAFLFLFLLLKTVRNIIFLTFSDLFMVLCRWPNSFFFKSIIRLNKKNKHGGFAF